MTYVAIVFVVLAALLYIFIYYLEVFGWNGDLARKIFGPQSPEELKITSFYAYNQGVYNLALAIIALLGAVFLTVNPPVGVALSLAGCASMLFAACALGFASARHRKAAVKQGFLPLVAVVCVLISLVL